MPEVARSVEQKASKFDRLDLPSIPNAARERIVSFIEDISSDYMLLGKAARCKPENAIVFSGANIQEALISAYSYDNSPGKLLRTKIRRTFGMKIEEPNSILREGFAESAKAALAAGRLKDYEAAGERAEAVAMNELSRKQPALDNLVIDPISTSARFFCSLLTVDDLVYPNKQIYTAHSKERWTRIEQGFGIFKYDGALAHLICQYDNTNTKLIRRKVPDRDDFGPFSVP